MACRLCGEWGLTFDNLTGSQSYSKSVLEMVWYQAKHIFISPIECYTDLPRLACTICFPNADHIVISSEQRVPLKFHLLYEHMQTLTRLSLDFHVFSFGKTKHTNIPSIVVIPSVVVIIFVLFCC